MRRPALGIAVAIALLAAILLINQFKPELLTAKRIEAKANVARSLAKADRIEIEQQVLVAKREKEKREKEAADPDAFRVKFECSMGYFIIECHPDWAPLGVAQFKEAIEAKIYDDARFFRVVPKFIVQFGIPADPKVAAVWKQKTLPDDPVIESNTRGIVSFAKTNLPNSRTTQLFINFGDNSRLDSMGFAPIGRVIQGMETVDKINSEYGENPSQDLIQKQGNGYLEAAYGRLDYVKTATIVEDEG